MSDRTSYQRKLLEAYLSNPPSTLRPVPARHFGEGGTDVSNNTQHNDLISNQRFCQSTDTLHSTIETFRLKFSTERLMSSQSFESLNRLQRQFDGFMSDYLHGCKLTSSESGAATTSDFQELQRLQCALQDQILGSVRDEMNLAFAEAAHAYVEQAALDPGVVQSGTLAPSSIATLLREIEICYQQLQDATLQEVRHDSFYLQFQNDMLRKEAAVKESIEKIERALLWAAENQSLYVMQEQRLQEEEGLLSSLLSSLHSTRDCLQHIQHREEQIGDNLQKLVQKSGAKKHSATTLNKKKLSAAIRDAEAERSIQHRVTQSVEAFQDILTTLLPPEVIQSNEVANIQNVTLLPKAISTALLEIGKSQDVSTKEIQNVDSVIQAYEAQLPAQQQNRYVWALHYTHQQQLRAVTEKYESGAVGVGKEPLPWPPLRKGGDSKTDPINKARSPSPPRSKNPAPQQKSTNNNNASATAMGPTTHTRRLQQQLPGGTSVTRGFSPKPKTGGPVTRSESPMAAPTAPTPTPPRRSRVPAQKSVSPSPVKPKSFHHEDEKQPSARKTPLSAGNKDSSEARISVSPEVSVLQPKRESRMTSASPDRSGAPGTTKTGRESPRDSLSPSPARIKKDQEVNALQSDKKQAVESKEKSVSPRKEVMKSIPSPPTSKSVRKEVVRAPSPASEKVPKTQARSPQVSKPGV
eukprot:PhF_6_TR41350/c0_g1_i1/m.62770